MVINTYYKFIFVHIPKTAGTSLERSLRSLRGNNPRWLTKQHKHESLSELDQNVHTRRSRMDRMWGRSPINYFTFGFVRNPWDRMSSLYRWIVERSAKRDIVTITSFKDFLVQARDGVDWIHHFHSMKPQVDFFTFDEGIMKIDYLGHYEYLNEDLKEIEKLIGCIIDIPHRNRSSNAMKDYRKEYDDDMIQIVESLFKDDISHFGYTFDTKYPSKRCSKRLNRRR